MKAAAKDSNSKNQTVMKEVKIHKNNYTDAIQMAEIVVEIPDATQIGKATTTVAETLAEYGQSNVNRSELAAKITESYKRLTDEKNNLFQVRSYLDGSRIEIA